MKLHVRDFASWGELVRYVVVHPDLQDHFVIGVRADGCVQFVHRSHVYTNVQVVGAVQTGKTARMLSLIIAQELLRKPPRQPTVLYLDPKGDNATCNFLFSLAKESGLPSRYVTLESDRASYGYFPLRQAQWLSGSIVDRTEILTSALSLDSGEFHPGETYFQNACISLVRGLVELLPNARSFRELYAATQDPRAHRLLKMTRHDFENAGAAVAQLAKFASIPQLNVGPPAVEAAAIDTVDLLRRAQFLCVRLPVNRVPTTGRAVVRVLLSQIVSAARALDRAAVPVMIVIDEFQHVARRDVIDIFKMIANANITLCVGHQNLSDLNRSGSEMLDEVMGNVHLRVFFSASDTLGAKYLKDTSGRRITPLGSSSRAVSYNTNGDMSMSWSSGTHDTFDTNIGNDELAELNARDGLCLFEAFPQRGLMQSRGLNWLYVPHLIELGEYQKLNDTPWPKGSPATMTGHIAPESNFVPPIVQNNLIVINTAAPLPKAKRKRKPKSPPPSDLGKYLFRLADEPPEDDA